MRTHTEQFGGLVKELRHQRELSQGDLGRMSKVSRNIISRLESGAAKAVRTDVLDRIFVALKSSPKVATGSPIDVERHLTHLTYQGKLSERRNRHLRLAVILSSDPKKAAELIKNARGQVALWRNRRLCSEQYIDRWSKLLRKPAHKLALAMTQLGDWEDALFQNSPWVGAWS